MLPAFASVEQFAVRVPGGVSDDDRPRAQGAVDHASTLVRAETGQAWVDAEGALALPAGDDAWKADVLVNVTFGAALRSFLNPQNVTGESEAVDGYNHAEQFANASPDVYLTASEKRQLASVTPSGGLFVVSTTRSDIGSDGRPGGIETSRCDASGTEYLDVVGGGPIPYTGPDGY